jgi:hypothetical protein
MGDGKAPTGTSTTTARTGTAAPRVTTRRSSRFQTRASTRMSSFQVERAPIVLEIGVSSTVLRVGYADQFQPQHILPVDDDDNDDKDEDASTNTNTKNNKSESQWYAVLAPMIQHVYDRLLCNPTTRRVVVVHPHYVPSAWQAALAHILWNKGVPAITFVSSLDILPVAQGWKRGLIVQVGKEETVCVCHADGHVLPFTYQSVPCGYQELLLLQDGNDNDNNRQNFLLLDEDNPNSLVVALLKCLETCPRDIRYSVISNLVFCGDGLVVVPDLGRCVAKRLHQLLEGTAAPLELKSEVPETEQETEQDQDKSKSTPRTTDGLTMVPIDMAALKPLADRLTVTSCAPYRPDLLSWVGSSLWAATWIKYDDEETKIQWKFAPID